MCEDAESGQSYSASLIGIVLRRNVEVRVRRTLLKFLILVEVGPDLHLIFGMTQEEFLLR